MRSRGGSSARRAISSRSSRTRASSASRQAAFAAAEYIMDYLKTEAPFWKQERFIDGREHWVEAKASDAQAAAQWAKP